MKLNQKNLTKLIKNPQLTKDLLRAHMGKPGSAEAYYKAFRWFTTNGRFQMRPIFSIYAFLGGPFYFLYRKMYAGAGIFFLVSVMSTILSLSVTALLSVMGYPFAMILNDDGRNGFLIIYLPIAVLCVLLILAPYIGVCMLTKYFYIKKFLNDLYRAGFGEAPDELVETVLPGLGGYNLWAVALYIFLLVTMLSHLWKNYLYLYF